MTKTFTYRLASSELTRAIAFGHEYDGRVYSADVPIGRHRDQVMAWDDVTTFHEQARGRNRVLVGYVVVDDCDSVVNVHWKADDALCESEDLEQRRGEPHRVLKVVLDREDFEEELVKFLAREEALQ